MAVDVSAAAFSDGGAVMASQMCAWHLSMLGVRTTGASAAPGTGEPRRLIVRDRAKAPSSSDAEPLVCGIHDGFPAEEGDRRLIDEATVQAASGLMAVHGRDRGGPRRIGLDVASVATGVLAAQGLLAALVGRARNQRVDAVRTSSLQGALVFLRHHMAAATCGDSWSLAPAGPAAGPPFATADGHWVELETLSPEAWRCFWLGLGASEELNRSWLAFAFRHDTATCKLPAELHEVAGRHTLSGLQAVADACGVAVCRVRSYPEVLDGWRDWAPWKMSSRASTTQATRPGTDAIGSLPLSGIRVLEVTSRLQGPLAGLLLRMLGAEVIKVEPPGGDPGRLVPPAAGADGAGFVAYNLGKTSVQIDYRGAAGRGELLDLVSSADVFLQNWRSGRAERLELDPVALAKVNPGLVYTHASGWGAHASGLPAIATDALVQAHAGCGQGISPGGEPPLASRITLLDTMGGLVACEGVLAALLTRERTGRGSTVETSLLSAAMTLQAPVLKALAGGTERGRCRGRPVWGMLDQPLETGTGPIVVARPVGPGPLSSLCGVCGVDPRAPEAEELIAERLRSRPLRDWEVLFDRAGVGAVAVREDLATIPADPLLAPLLERAGGACWVPGTPWSFSP